MDQEEELAKFKSIIFSGLVFLISAYFSFGELKFAIWGKNAEAKITRTHETRSSGRRAHPMIQIEYQFTEADGTGRSERADVAVDWPVSTTGMMTVQYLPGVADSSRPLGQSKMTAVYVFLAALAWLGFNGYKLCKLANEPIRGSARSRR